MTGDIAHVCNRGIDKQKIFLSEEDKTRFVLDLYRFNNKEGAIRIKEGENKFHVLNEKQDKLVEILKWCLMPNHYHLLLYEASPGGIVEFVKRLGNGYTKYFNIKNKKKGAGYLFQNSARIIHIENQRHFNYIPFYIDLNPLALYSPELWIRSSGEIEKHWDFLERYKWSSLNSYYNKNEFSNVANSTLFFELFERKKPTYKKEVCELIELNQDYLLLKENIHSILR